MKVSASLIECYPNMALWITNKFPEVRKNTKVFKAFQKYSELKEDAERAIRDGTLPTVEWRRLGAENGQYDHKKYPDTVFIAMAICEKFEKSEADAKDPRMHRLIESTLLHEIVHWGDWKDGKLSPYAEAGKEFEKEAYGEDVRRYW
jgi:Metallopeptidase toxin 3